MTVTTILSSKQMTPTKPDLAKFDAWLRAASLLCTGLLIPGVGWAWNMSEKLAVLSSDLTSLRQQVESERRGNNAVLDELKLIRSSVENLKSDLQQRLTRVETRLDK